MNIPVPLLNVDVSRLRQESAKSATEVTQTNLEQYYLLPEDVGRGIYAHRMNFTEAINYFTI